MTNIARRFAALALVALAVPLFASSPEYQVGATVPAPAPHYRNGAAAATDGTDFFVLWSDGRTPGRGAIIGTRVNRTGEVLDPLGIRIASGTGTMTLPAVAWDGAAYVVVWTQSQFMESNVVAARVDRDGRIATAPRVIAEDATTALRHYAASNGNVTVVAYRQFTSSGASRAAVLDRELNVLHREALTNRSSGFLGGISVAATQSRFVIAWSSAEATISAMALDSDGRVVRTPTEIGTGEEPVVATDGTNFTLVSRRLVADGARWELLGRTLDPDLAQIGDTRSLASEDVLESLSLLWRGDRYEVLAGYVRNQMAPYGFLSIELDRDGDKVASRTRGDLARPRISPQPVAVTNGSDVLIAYTQPVPSGANVVARMYRGSSPVAEVEELLSWSGNAHEVPQIASSPSGHLVAWSEDGGVSMTRVDANGNSLDGRGTHLSEGDSVRVAFAGTNYVVAYRSMDSIRVRYVAPATGATLDEVAVPAETWAGFALAVTPDATYLAIAEDRIRMMRIPHATRVPGAPLLVSPVNMPVENPALSWNGSTLLVAWNEVWSGNYGPPYSLYLNVLAARVTGNLTLLDPAPILVTPAGEVSSLSAPSIASNGKDWLVVADHDGRDVVARRVLDNGNVEGAAATKIADGAAPEVTWDGARYAIAFKGGNGVEEPLLLGSVPASGTLPMMRRTLVATDVVSTPSIARTAGGDVAIVYTKLSFRPEHAGVERSYLRVMELHGRGRVVRR